MIPHDEAGYRIALAEMHLRTADALLGSSNWAHAALLARSAIENAAKACLACFGSVPRTHEPADVLGEALRDARFPASVLPRGQALLPVVTQYGLPRHIQLAYGDEQNFLLPDTLVSEADARRAVADARATIQFATDVRAAVLGP